MIYQLITFALILKIVQQILFDLYLWQLKEYRFDRVEEHIERIKKSWISVWIYLTVGAPFSLKKLPKLTGKSILLLIINLGFLYFITLVGFIPLLGTVFATPALILASIFCILPIEWTIRRLIYFMASQKVKKLEKDGLVVIGITGSYGKSTTKSFINQILSAEFKTLSTPGSVNTPFAISSIILKQLNLSHKFFIVEMGAYKRGEITELCNIASPDVAIVTGISNQHLALFGNQNNLIEAKSEILENLDKNSLVLINKSSEFLPKMEGKIRGKVIFYGTSQTDKKYHKFKDLTPVPDFLKLNLEPGLILAEQYKIGPNEFKDILKDIQTPETVVKIIKGRVGVSLIDDSRSSNFKGAIAALDYLESLKSKKKVVVMSCLIELGSVAVQNHQQIGKILEKVSDLAIITTDDFFESIKKGANQSEKIILLDKKEEIIGRLNEFLDPDSAVLIEGRIDPEILNFLKNK